MHDQRTVVVAGPGVEAEVVREVAHFAWIRRHRRPPFAGRSGPVALSARHAPDALIRINAAAR
jgi:hypothetical protein